MTFSDLLDQVGGMGRFQFIQLVMLALPITMMACHNLLQNFSAGIPLHHCRVVQYKNSSYDGNYTILTDRDLVRVYIPLAENQKADKCLQFTQPQWGLLHQNATADNLTGVGTQPCTDGWTYDTSVFTATIITEWDLVCDQRTMGDIAQSIYMGGVVVTSIVVGILSDRFGRRTILMWCYLQIAVSGTCAACSPNFIAYCIFRFFVGIAVSGMVLNTTSLNVEWLPTHARTFIGTLTSHVYTLGQFLLAGIAYGIPNWRHLQLATSVPFFLFFLYSWWFSESARWLVMARKPEQAVKLLRRAAKLNGKMAEGEKITIETLKIDLEKEMAASKSTYTVLDLGRTPSIRRISIGISILWFSTTFVYYGVAMDLQNFGVNIYLIQVIFGAVDIPAKILGTFSMGYIGRRLTQSMSLGLAGTAILANIFVPYDMQTLRTSLAVIGKGCLAVAFNCAFLYTSELYPTVIRNAY